MSTIQRETRDWLLKRGISETTLKAAGVTYDDQKITIPIRNFNGDFSFNKYRRSPFIDEGPKYRYDTGAQVELYLGHWITRKKPERVVICEGELDALLLHSKGVPAVTSTGGAGSFQAYWRDLFTDIEDVLIVMDNDDAGMRGAFRIQEFIPYAKIGQLPDMLGKGGDITDLYLEGGSVDSLPTITYDLSIPEKTENEILEYKERIIWGSRLAQHYRIQYADPKYAEHYVEVIQDRIQDIKRTKAARDLPKLDGGNIVAAKNVPISNFIKFNRQGFAKSLWNPNERTPSMKYYPDKNRVWCYSTAQGGDVIDVVKIVNNTDFAGAMKILTGN